MIDINEIRKIANEEKATEIDFQENIKLISFIKEGTRINIYYSKMTIGTCLAHPKKNNTQLFRKNIDLFTLKEIFKNPRKHTGIGYYKSKQK